MNNTRIFTFLFLTVLSTFFINRNSQAAAPDLVPCWGDGVNINYGYCGAVQVDKEAFKHSVTSPSVSLQYSKIVAAVLDDQRYILATRFDVASFHGIELGLDLGLSYGFTSCEFGLIGREKIFCPSLAVEAAYTKYQLQPVIMLASQTASFGIRYKF